MIGGLLCAIVVLQFAEAIPWAGEEATYIGGRWTGVVIYAAAAGFFFAAGYAWLTVKPWASMITILAAIIGFFVPFISHMDGTDPRSSAIAPLIVSVLMLFMVFRPSTNRAMAVALSGQGSAPTAKKAPPPKPMSAARKRELAEEQKKAAKQPATAKPAPAAAPASSPSPAPAMATSAAAPVPAAVATPAKTAATMVMSAASSLKSAAATPASPRRSLTNGSRSSTPTPAPAPAPARPAAAAPPAPTSPGKPLRADDV
jgi:hypothetical protein